MSNNQSNHGNKHTDRQAQRNLLRKSTWIILIGITLTLSATYLVVKQSPSIRDHYEAKRNLPTNQAAVLKAFIENKSGQHSPLQQLINPNDKIIFKISAIKSTYVALAKAINNEEPHIVYHSRMPPGKNHLFEKAGKKFIYTVNRADKSAKFCLIEAEDMNQLMIKARSLPQLWTGISESACVQLQTVK